MIRTSVIRWLIVPVVLTGAMACSSGDATDLADGTAVSAPSSSSDPPATTAPPSPPAPSTTVAASSDDGADDTMSSGVAESATVTAVGVLAAAVLLAEGDVEQAVADGIVTADEVDAAVAAIEAGTLEEWAALAEG